ncbi:MAG: hypothetical protein DIZ80_04745 [endosymbiont of Galathealinum brachiosum]|uniref:Uncharacterized protein n=1 Tax=endosymbiont of Galathealinum brachiosum TaxID=2200906 RepID=A0A370DKD6_9GAMM|nr:MAG: hypothetical protein DIZ80_04745 [endosymbiont of Galathealinum brachiosum]
MEDNQDNKFADYMKRAWIIYALIIIALIAVLVLFVASDNEEMVFFGFMTPAAAYVFRPTNRYIARLVFKYTGVSEAKEQE